MLSHSQSSLQPLVRKLAYWAGADSDWGKFNAADEEALLSLPHKLKSIERHGYVVREREKATHSCVMLSGFAMRYKVVASGARQIVAVQ